MGEFARFISRLLYLYNILIVVRILLQWVNQAKLRDNESDFGKVLASIVDPYLNIFRNLTFLKRGTIDFTPLVALWIVGIFQKIFLSIANAGRFSIGIILATIIQTFWSSIVSLVLTVLIIVLAVRIYLSYNRNPNSIRYIALIDNVLRKLLDFVHTNFFRGREVSSRTLLWSTLALVIVVYIVCSLLIGLLISVLV
ncbi:MAG: YggT family protein [Candidatus Cloacimonetes bacterium]|nr:YggT family protein [Candidatus Cloacimonadota bacterium]